MKEIKIFAEKEGFVSGIDNFGIGMSALELGAGRLTKEDKIDPKAGIIFHAKIGQKIGKNDIIAEIFTDRKNQVENVKNKIQNSITYSDKKVPKPKLIKQIIT